jgi:hypothetical protein
MFDQQEYCTAGKEDMNASWNSIFGYIAPPARKTLSWVTKHKINNLAPRMQDPHPVIFFFSYRNLLIFSPNLHEWGQFVPVHFNRITQRDSSLFWSIKKRQISRMLSDFVGLSFRSPWGDPILLQEWSPQVTPPLLTSSTISQLRRLQSTQFSLTSPSHTGALPNMRYSAQNHDSQIKWFDKDQQIHEALVTLRPRNSFVRQQ